MKTSDLTGPFKSEHLILAHLVMVEVWIVTFDYSLSILFVPYIMFPAIAGYCMGYLSNFGIPTEYQGLVILILVGYVCTGILCVFEHRFYIVCAFQGCWRWFRKIWLGGHYIVVTLLYTSFLLYIPDQKGQKEKVFKILPCLPRYLYEAPIIVMSEDYTYHGLVCSSFMIVFTIESFIFNISVMWSSMRQLKTKKMSPKNFQIQKATFIALLIQMKVPLIMIILPSIYGWTSLLLHYHNQALMNLAVIIGSLHGAFSTIVMITVHRPYRETIGDLFRDTSTRVELSELYQRKDLFVVMKN